MKLIPLALAGVLSLSALGALTSAASAMPAAGPTIGDSIGAPVTQAQYDGPRRYYGPRRYGPPPRRVCRTVVERRRTPYGWRRVAVRRCWVR